MPEIIVPGVYIRETSTGSQLIEGTPTSTAAFVGVTRKGPRNKPKIVKSFADYSEMFGLASPKVPVSIAVLQFFSNGGRKAVIVRTSASRNRKKYCPDPEQLIGDSKSQTGIHALGLSEPTGLLLTPDAAQMPADDAKKVAEAVLKFCQDRRIFHILDIPLELSRQKPVQAAVKWSAQSEAIKNRNAAVYFPQIMIADPSAKNGTLQVSPSGAVAGLYARFELGRGVWKAPAGLDAKLHTARGVEIELTNQDMTQLEKASINPVRCIADHGIVAWGARTFLADANDQDWRYVSMRRLALFIQESLYRGLTWAVFKPNGEALWAEIRLAVSSFMNQLFRSGAFQGSHAGEAYIVECSQKTMTRRDIDAGRIIVQVGFAPLKPAEFTILRIDLCA